MRNVDKLIKTAEKYADSKTQFPSAIWMGFYNEKFAELLIQSCASICEDNGASYKYSFSPGNAALAESTSNYCGKLIKQHFGVS